MNYNEIKFVSRNLPEEAVSYGPVRFSSSQFSVLSPETGRPIDH